MSNLTVDFICFPSASCCRAVTLNTQIYQIDCSKKKKDFFLCRNCGAIGNAVLAISRLSCLR